MVLFVAGLSLLTFSKLSLNAALVSGSHAVVSGFSPSMHISILMSNVLVKHSSDQMFKLSGSYSYIISGHCCILMLYIIHDLIYSVNID